MPRRNTAGYDLSDTARRVVDEFCASKGMNKKTAVERVMAWFARQPAPIKSLVTGLVDEPMNIAYAAALEQWAAELRAGRPAEPAFTDLGAHDIDPRDAQSQQLRTSAAAQRPRPRSHRAARQ